MKYVQQFQAKGKTYYYFRIGGVKQRLPDDPSSPAFQARYRELLATVEVTRLPALTGSIEALITDYKRSPEFADKLRPKTRQSYDRELKKLSGIKNHRACDLKRIHILKIRDKDAAKPRTADLFIQVTRRLLSWAVDRGYIEFNPLLRVSLINEPESHKPWTELDCATFESSSPSRALITAYMLGRYTGQRRGDVLAMEWSSYDGSGIKVVQTKTRAEVWIPAHQRLRAHLNGLDRSHGYILTNSKDKRWDDSTFTHAFGNHLRAHGLDGLTFHGLRHTAATELAEAGCSEREIQAITGHKTTSMVSRYTAKADQKRRASAAILKMERR